MYSGLTEDICQQAWEIVLPSIEHAAATDVTNKQAGTIVVLDPYTGDLLFVEAVDPNHPDVRKYDEIAHAKARVSWETGLPSRIVQQEAPHLYKPGMTKWGGAVIEHRVVVAFSGVQAVFDEAIAWSMLAWIFAFCRNEMTKPDGTMANNDSYIRAKPTPDYEA